MMRWLYNIAIIIYLSGIRVFSLFNSKARKWIAGRRQIFDFLGKIPSDGRPVAWFHCSSLGEFEQGRPVFEAFHTQNPRFRILLTFFSPSGYDVKKNYEVADFVCYMPPDTPRNARRFIEILNPSLVMFVKYEYWHNYISEITRRTIPFYVLSANFRRDQYFFRWWGKWFLKNLKQTTLFFVQTQNSAELLQSHGINQVLVTGDTRFDRVLAVARQHVSFPVIEKFVKDQLVMVAGSTWLPDEEMLARLAQKSEVPLKLIIAPHETTELHLRKLETLFPEKPVRLSRAELLTEPYEVLIIDSIGMLSFAYRYGQIAYIGGGFGVGIHNVLEAAVYGIPVIFGPKFDKFREAQELIALGGAFCVKDYSGLVEVFSHLCSNPEAYKKSAEICREYVVHHAGATQKVLQCLKP